MERTPREQGLPSEALAKEGFSPEEANQLQIALIKTFGLEPDEWVKKYAKEFREIIEANPEFAEEYRNNPEEAARIIALELQKSKETYR